MSQLRTITERTATIILLVDDDPDVRMLTRDAIAQSGLVNEVREAAGGREATEYLTRCAGGDAARPDLIYLDIDMPGMSGQDVLKWIRSREELDDVPVVMMTGLDDEAQKLQAARNGANSYTLKPTNPAEFLRTVHEATDYWTLIHQLPRRRRRGA